VLWVRVLIWVSLAALGVTVVAMTLRGGPIPEGMDGAIHMGPSTVEPGVGTQGEMAYDRWRPGHRNDPERLREATP